MMKKILFYRKTPHNNRFKLINLGMRKLQKSYIGFLWVCLIWWLCIFKMQNHPSKLGIHWWKCTTPIHKPTKYNLIKSCIIYRKTRWPLIDALPSFLIDLMWVQGEHNGRTRSWGMLLGSQHFGGKGACSSSRIGIRKSDKQVNYSHGPTQTKQQVG
jgi:hypothetical protein